MFQVTKIDLGMILAKRMKILSFPYTDLKIISLVSSCGCGLVYDKGDRVEVQYTPIEVPIHLKSHNSYMTEKYVTVTTQNSDGTSQQTVLVFTATIKDF